MFRGNLLHGVIPGHGLPVDPTARRITLMIAFWKEITIRPFNENEPCAAQAFPLTLEARASSEYTWLKEVDASEIEGVSTSSSHTGLAKERSETLVDAVPTFVPKVWEPVKKRSILSFAAEESDHPTYDECFQGF